MKFLAALIVALGVVTGAQATPRIDPGGNIFERLNAMQDIESTGATFHISGICISACTMYLGLKKVCLEPGSLLAFHSAAEIDEKGNYHISKFGDDILMTIYPQNIRDWIIKHNALSSLD